MLRAAVASWWCSQLLSHKSSRAYAVAVCRRLADGPVIMLFCRLCCCVCVTDVSHRHGLKLAAASLGGCKWRRLKYTAGGLARKSASKPSKAQPPIITPRLSNGAANSPIYQAAASCSLTLALVCQMHVLNAVGRRKSHTHSAGSQSLLCPSEVAPPPRFLAPWLLPPSVKPLVPTGEWADEHNDQHFGTTTVRGGRDEDEGELAAAACASASLPSVFRPLQTFISFCIFAGRPTSQFLVFAA